MTAAIANETPTRPVTRTPDLRVYRENMAALFRCDAELAAAIDAIPFSSLPKLEAARDGTPTASVSGDHGRPIYLHSRHRPLEEAAAFVAAQGDTGTAVVLLAGVGLGYHLLEFERRGGRPRFLVAEPDLATLKAALCVSDLSRLFSAGRLLVLTSSAKPYLHARLRHYLGELIGGLHVAALPHTRRCAAAFHRELLARVTDYVAYCRMQVVTLAKVTRASSRNIALNLPHYLRSAGVGGLAGRAAGYPAIVVAAGPSLARNVQMLRGLRERAVIIAVQTVYKLLRSLDIEPHIVTSLDYHEASADFFRGIEHAGDTLLVAEPKVNWQVLDLFVGRKLLLHNGLADQLLRSLAPPRASLKPGCTVAHLAFYVAQYLRCDPILLVGQDLCFSEGLYYPPGVPIEKTWAPELGRYQTVEMKQWERIARHRPVLRTVKDVHGRDTYTDDTLFTYAEQFETDFAAAAAQPDAPRVVHAGEAGMRLAGTEVMSLREAAERFCTRRLPDNLLSDQIAAQPTPADLTAAATEIEARVREIREARQVAAETIALLERLEGLVEQPSAFNRQMVRLDELRLRMRELDATYRLVVDVSQTAEIRRLTADRSLEDIDDETPQTARRRLRRDRQFVTEFVEGCEWLERVLPEAAARLRAAAAEEPSRPAGGARTGRTAETQA